tara:strand:- start:98 stop:226 length:129 start_codon:yes stop_codon:yes gene_type:complete
MKKKLSNILFLIELFDALKLAIAEELEFDKFIFAASEDGLKF